MLSTTSVLLAALLSAPIEIYKNKTMREQLLNLIIFVFNWHNLGYFATNLFDSA